MPRFSVFINGGFLYGDGVFEGIRIYNRRIFRLDAHLSGLSFGALPDAGRSDSELKAAIT